MTIFQPTIDQLPASIQKQVWISKEQQMVCSVSSAGMEAGRRVIDLTAPLAMAGIPILFITTYYTDFILVPSKDQHAVVQTLLARGFEFSETIAAYVAPQTSSHTHSRTVSAASEPPSTPPPSNVAELQQRTFAQLRRRKILPFIAPTLLLAQCAGRELSFAGEHYRPSSNGLGQNPSSTHWTSNLDTRLYLGLVAALVQQPRFLSLTLSSSDAPSVLLDKILLPLFGSSLTGDTEGDLVPVFLNLETLPLESTGIVCGVAGSVVDELRLDTGENSELSYLSTARAGAVILSRHAATRAVEGLETLLHEGSK